MFQHPFVSQPLSRTLAIELLDKANNPDHSTYNDFDDDDPEPEVNFDLLKNHTSQHRGDFIFTGFHFLPLKSHPSLFSLAHNPPFIPLVFCPFSPFDTLLNFLHFVISLHPPLLAFSLIFMPYSIHLAVFFSLLFVSFYPFRTSLFPHPHSCPSLSSLFSPLCPCPHCSSSNSCSV